MAKAKTINMLLNDGTLNGVISMEIPSEQTACQGTLTENYAVAKSDQTNLSFYNICGLMGFKITRSDIVKVTLSAVGAHTLNVVDWLEYVEPKSLPVYV